MRQDAGPLRQGAGRGQRCAALPERARQLAPRHHSDERRNRTHGGARLAGRKAHGRRLQAGRRIPEDGKALRRQKRIYQRVPRQEREDAADQSAEALLSVLDWTGGNLTQTRLLPIAATGRVRRSRRRDKYDGGGSWRAGHGAGTATWSSKPTAGGCLPQMATPPVRRVARDDGG